MIDFNKEIKTLKPLDFDEKWSKWLKEVHDVKNNVDIVSIKEEGFGKIIDFYFDSVKNTKIFARLFLRNEPNRPIVAYYHGHNSYVDDENNVWHCMNLVCAGCNVMMMDMRNQNGKVIDPNKYNYEEYLPSCYNCDDLENSYTKLLDQDALKMIDIIKDESCFKEIANQKIIVAGPSQGGGLSLMVASFVPDIALSLSDVPSDCALKDRIDNREGKYTALSDFLKDHPEKKDVVMNNQDYFDVVNMAKNIKCPVITSVGTIDRICPPEYFYKAYDKITSEKEIHYYEGFGHGGFEEIHLPKKIEFLKKHIKF